MTFGFLRRRIWRRPISGRAVQPEAEIGYSNWRVERTSGHVSRNGIVVELQDVGCEPPRKVEVREGTRLGEFVVWQGTWQYRADVKLSDFDVRLLRQGKPFLRPTAKTPLRSGDLVKMRLRRLRESSPPSGSQ